MLSTLFTLLVATSSSFFVPQTVFAATIPQLPPIKTVQELAAQIAYDHGIASSTLFNMVDSESDWDTDVAGDFDKKTGTYCSYGLVQINICAHPEVAKSDAIDPTFALTYAAKAIAAGTESDDWTSCNCYSLVWTKVPNLPRMADLKRNTDVPHTGDVAIFYYHDKETGHLVKHVAYVTSVSASTFTVLEANKTHCLVDTRVVPNSDLYIAGFWDPKGV